MAEQKKKAKENIGGIKIMESVTDTATVIGTVIAGVIVLTIVAAAIMLFMCSAAVLFAIELAKDQVGKLFGREPKWKKLRA